MLDGRTSSPSLSLVTHKEETQIHWHFTCTLKLLGIFLDTTTSDNLDMAWTKWKMVVFE